VPASFSVNRRGFILMGAALTLGAHAENNTDETNIILGGGQFLKEGIAETNFVLSIVDMSTETRHLSPLTFLAHGIHRNPTNLNRLAIFEKKGPNAVEFDLDTRQVVRSIPRINNRYFYGHGAYSLDGQRLFSTETQLDTLNGVIAIRNAGDLSTVGEFPSYGKEPHECKLIDAGKTLVVTNGGGDSRGDRPSVTYIDVQSQQLIEKVELTNSQLNTGHLAISPKGDLVVVSAPRLGSVKNGLGGVSIRPQGKAIQSISSPAPIIERMRGEALSVAVHSGNGIAAVTHPDGGMVTFWSIEDRSLLKVIELPHPRGVALINRQQDFLVSYGRDANLASIPANTLELDPQSIIHSSYITGSHIYNWSQQMTEMFYPKGA